MDKNRENKIFYAGDEFDFESIMREFGSERGDAEIDYDAIGSKPVTYDDIEDILSTDLSVDEGYDYPPESEPDAEEVPEEEDIIDSIVDEYTDGSETEATKVFKPVQDDELVTDGISDEDISPEDYAEDGDYEAGKDEEPKPKRCERRKARSFSELVVTPFISALALIALKVQQSKLPLSFSADDDEELGEELPPEKASRFYESFIGGLHIRVRIAFVLSLVLTYISFGLPVMGAMNATAVKSAVCLILLLAVMICGLDIMTSGLIAIAHRRPNANTLITLSALFCVIDGFLAACGVKGTKLPFCAIPALTISFSLLGSLLNCRSSRIVFNTVSSSRKPYTVTAETSVTGDGVTILKSRMTTKGFVRRTEEAGPDETVYGVMAPYLIVIALLLSLISAAVSKSFAQFAHILSGIFVCAAPLAILLTYPLANFVSAKTLIKSGSAIAGWSGIYDIGKCRHMIITDFDLFPKGSVTISQTRIFAGMKPEKVVSLAGSMIAASGSALSPAFAELMKQGKGSLLRVENFRCHEGGGLIAMVDGVEVYCGSASFMHLMGVHLPDMFKIKNCVYVSEGDTICGMFQMEYTPVDSVRDALYMLMRSDRHPVFAVRDFNITPQLLSVKYDIPTDGFDFPSFAQRYEISGAEPSEASKPAALVSREGLGAFVHLAEHAKGLYTRVRVSVMLSVMSTVIGMIVMFILSLTGQMTVTTALSFLLVWLIPVLVIGFCFSE
ncbi:MAG: hypothetical protein MSB05_01030 [Firmicutes bacterium]|nr:hypothetical protein [Bacillota bacterium]